VKMGVDVTGPGSVPLAVCGIRGIKLSGFAAREWPLVLES
jgi:hypothetical protein